MAKIISWLRNPTEALIVQHQKHFRKPVDELQRMTKLITLLNIIYSHLWKR